MCRYISLCVQVGGVQPQLPGPAAGLHLPEDDHLHLAPAGPGGRLGGHVSSEASLYLHKYIFGSLLVH